MERGQIAKAALLWGLCVPGSKAEAKSPTLVSSAGTWHSAFYIQHTPGSLHANGEGKMCGSREGGERRGKGSRPGAVGWLRSGKAQVDLSSPHCSSSGPAEEGLICVTSLPPLLRSPSRPWRLGWWLKFLNQWP